MTQEKAEKKFPHFFPQNIVPVGAKFEPIEVYRVCVWGKIDKDAFISTYEQKCIRGNIAIRDIDITDPGTYSTSCNEKINHARRRHKLFSKHYPKPIVARGKTNGLYGPSQRTEERTGKKDNSHVDWWLYEGSDPSSEFEEVDVYENS